MVDQDDARGARPTRGRPGRGLRVAGVALASVTLVLIVAISAAVLVPVNSCACATPLDLVVQNYSRQEASVTWSQPGLLGTPLRGLSGGEVASACRTLSAGLRSGVVEVSVTTATESRTFSLHVRDAHADVPTAIVIDVGGHVADPILGAPPGGWRQGDELC